MSYCTIQFFDHTTFQTDYGYVNMSSLITYPYVSQSDNDDSIDEPIKFFLLFTPTLVKDSQSHHPMRLHRMFSPPKKSDRFLIDYSQPLCILHHTQNIPHTSQSGMLENTPK